MHTYQLQGLAVAPLDTLESWGGGAISDREPSSQHMDINVRQIQGYKNSHPHSAYSQLHPSASSASSQLLIVDSSTLNVMYADMTASGFSVRCFVLQ